MHRNNDKWTIRALGIFFALAIVTPVAAHAKGFDQLYAFRGASDGDLPEGTLLADSSGNLFGTTAEGGGTESAGTIFKLASDGTKTVLYSFCSQSACSDGSHPYAGLIADNQGNLYGTTVSGGAAGSGVAFKLAPDGTETVLYSFCSQAGCADGANPYSPLTADEFGNLYGTTWVGGSSVGVVFKIAPDGTETVLHTFAGGADGASPYAGLLRDKKGNLYGTTVSGGIGDAGVVFKLSSDGAETVLYSFCSQSSCTDGSAPYAGLVRDTNGNLDGTTTDGGASNSGVVFQLAPDGLQTVLHTFCTQSSCNDGWDPAAGVILDRKGNIFGTTWGGGARGSGVVFKLAPDHTVRVMHGFSDNHDGGGPNGLTSSDGGFLVGTTQDGGRYNGGTIFRIKK